MSYNKTNWVNSVTDLNETNMNKIENELELLAGKSVATAGEDLDDYINEGIYYFDAGYTPTNIPTGVNGWLVVFANGNFIKQVWFRHGSIAGNNDFETFVRTRVDSSNWSDWRRFIVEDELYYQTGESITINNAVLNGCITGDAKNIYLSLNLPKKLNKISSLSVSNLIGNIRGISGYIDSDYTATTNFNTGDYTTSIVRSTDTLIEFNIQKSTQFSNATNNTPVTANVQIQINLN